MDRLFTPVPLSRCGICSPAASSPCWAAALWMTYTRRLTASRVLLLMMAAGFLLRAAYILYTTVLTRQHDMGTFDNIYGHAGYIRYLYDNGHLPDFDP